MLPWTDHRLTEGQIDRKKKKKKDTETIGEIQVKTTRQWTQEEKKERVNEEESSRTPPQSLINNTVKSLRKESKGI